MRALLTATVCSALLASACGTSHAPDGDDPAARAAFFDRYYRLTCEESVWCAERASGRTSCAHPDDRPWQQAVDRAGANVTFDPIAAEECLAALGGRGECADGRARHEACEDVFRPSRDVGESCALPAGDLAHLDECIGDAVCVQGDSCPARCQALRAEGEPCDGSAECRGLCVEGRCVDLPGPGEECLSIFGSLGCALDLVCDDDLCTERPGRGEECTAEPSYPLCAGDDVCLPDSDGTLRCAEPLPRGAGELCRYSHDCQGPLVCRRVDLGFGVCSEGVAPGGSCAETPCAPGGTCVDGRCTAVAFPGEACGPLPGGPICPSTYACAGGRCVLRPLLGEACEPGLDCLRGECVDGRCSLLPAGTDCDRSRDTCAGFCVEGTCTAPLALGERCRGWGLAIPSCGAAPRAKGTSAPSAACPERRPRTESDM